MVGPVGQRRLSQQRLLARHRRRGPVGHGPVRRPNRALCLTDRRGGVLFGRRGRLHGRRARLDRPEQPGAKADDQQSGRNAVKSFASPHVLNFGRRFAESGAYTVAPVASMPVPRAGRLNLRDSPVAPVVRIGRRTIVMSCQSRAGLRSRTWRERAESHRRCHG